MLPRWATGNPIHDGRVSIGRGSELDRLAPVPTAAHSCTR